MKAPQKISRTRLQVTLALFAGLRRRCAPRGVIRLRWLPGILLPIVAISVWALSAQAQSPDVASLTTPVNGASGIDPTYPVTFSWAPVSDALTYYLYVGTSVGAEDIYDSYEVQTTSLMVRLGPARTYYARLWTNTASGWYYTDSSFTTANGIASLITPANGTSGLDPLVQFTWCSIPDALTYYLYIGTSVGAQNVYGSGEVTVSSLSVTLSSSTTYYARLWTKKASGWYYTDTTFTTGTGIAHLTAPANGASNLGPSVQFTWNEVSDALSYYLYLGTSVGAQDVYGSGEVTATSTSVTLLPSATYYARLWTKKASGWYYSDSSFTAGTGIAHLINPTNGQSGINPVLPVQFSWNAVSDALKYYLYVGTSVGAKDVYDSSEVTVTSLGVNLLPSTTYYARLWTKKSSGWYYADCSFATGVTYARFTSPVNGAMGVDPFAPLAWTSVGDADSYGVFVGQNPNVHDLYIAAPLANWVTGKLPWGLQPNQTYYAQISTKKNGVWYTDQVTFQTAPPGVNPTDTTAFHNTIETLTAETPYMLRQDDTVVPGSVLYNDMLEVMEDPTKPGATCGDFAMALLDLFSQVHILARRRDVTFDSHETHVTVEYQDPFLAKWVVADPTFGIVYFDSQFQIGESADDINAWLRTGATGPISFQLVTSYGDQLARSYYLDPLTLYNNVIPMGADVVAQSTNPPLLTPQTFTAVAGVAGTYVFQFAIPSDTLTVSNAGNVQTITAVTADNWSAVVQLSSGWSVVGQVPNGAQVATPERILF